MKIVCQQPHYLPWLGYLELFAQSDAFVFLDNVQWIKQGRQHRTKILQGTQSRWLTIPVKSAGHREKTLKDMEVDVSQPWAKAHWHSIERAYGKAPRFRDQVEPLFRPFFEKMQKEKFLVDICQEGLWLFWEPLGLKAELHWASDLPEVPGQNERLIGLCQHFGAREYYSSLGSTRYLDMGKFREAGIRVLWQHFRASFPGDLLRATDVSALDWIAHHDFSAAKTALQGPGPLFLESELSI
jgi:hypothetical protein